MRGSARLAAMLGGVVLALAACTASTSPVASVSPQQSPSTVPSPSAVATPSASPSPTEVPSPAGPALGIASLPVHNGEVGVGYLAVQFTPKNGTAPYTWSVASGQMPPGLALSSGGLLTGKNTSAGTFSLSARVTDSTGATATGKVTMTVFSAFAVSQPCSKACNVGVGCTACGGFGSFSGGAGPYVYKLVSGAPPSGMTWSKLGVNGAFPSVAGPGLSVQVTDGFGVARTVAAHWNIFQPIDITNTSGGCYSGPGPRDCVDNSVTYSLGNPSDKVGIVVVKACYEDNTQGYICSDDATPIGPISSYMPPAWTATAVGGVVTVGMDCGTSPGDTCSPRTGYYGWYGDVFIVVVDKGACVAPANAKSAQQADVNIDI